MEKVKANILRWILKTFYDKYTVAYNLIINDNMEVYFKNRTIMGKEKVMIKGNKMVWNTEEFEAQYKVLVEKYGKF